ncbi:LytR C-terminal domain-containing protein [Streptomyces xiamenensis]
MTAPIPAAALAVMAAAADDYRVVTPRDEQHPAGLAQTVATYLLSAGYEVRPMEDLPSGAWGGPSPATPVTADEAARHRADLLAALTDNTTPEEN